MRDLFENVLEDWVFAHGESRLGPGFLFNKGLESLTRKGKRQGLGRGSLYLQEDLERVVSDLDPEGRSRVNIGKVREWLRDSGPEREMSRPLSRSRLTTRVLGLLIKNCGLDFFLALPWVKIGQLEGIFESSVRRGTGQAKRALAKALKGVAPESAGTDSKYTLENLNRYRSDYYSELVEHWVFYRASKKFGAELDQANSEDPPKSTYDHFSQKINKIAKPIVSRPVSIEDQVLLQIAIFFKVYSLDNPTARRALIRKFQEVEGKQEEVEGKQEEVEGRQEEGKGKQEEDNELIYKLLESMFNASLGNSVAAPGASVDKFDSALSIFSKAVDLPVNDEPELNVPMEHRLAIGFLAKELLEETSEKMALHLNNIRSGKKSHKLREVVEEFLRAKKVIPQKDLGINAVVELIKGDLEVLMPRLEYLDIKAELLKCVREEVDRCEGPRLPKLVVDYVLNNCKVILESAAEHPESPVTQDIANSVFASLERLKDLCSPLSFKKRKEAKGDVPGEPAEGDVPGESRNKKQRRV